MTASRRRLLLVGVVAVLAVLATGALVVRDGDDGDGADPARSAVLPLRGTVGEAPARPALAVKIDNTAGGRPPTGLRAADIVYEELVEGGLTRLLAVYHSEDPGEVGPVRSARSTDLAILPELGRPLFAWSGANPTFRAAVEAADLVDVGVSAVPGAYRRDPDRPAPYDLFAAPAELRAAAGGGQGPDRAPPPQFEYREPGAPLAGDGVEDATGFRAATDATRIEWTWDAPDGRWQRSQDGTPHVDRAGDRVAVPNVLVRATPYRDSGVRDAAGAVVPEAAMVGEGDAWLLSDGRVQAGRWHKPSAGAATTFTAPDGTPLRLAPGQTWVEVLPPGTGEVVGGSGGGP